MRPSILFLLASCSTDEKTGDSAPPGACEVEVVSTRPENGADDAFYRDAVEFNLSEADPTAAFTMTGPAGEVAGVQSFSGDTVVFVPSAPLDAGTEYSATLSLCEGERNPSISFRTSGIEPPVPDPTGKAYVMDLAGAEVVQPGGFGEIVIQVLTAEVMLGVDSATETTIQMTGAVSEVGSWTQDTCLPTIAFPEADFSENPWFELGPGDATFAAMDSEITVHDLYLTGAFAPNLFSIGGGTLDGELDARELAVVMVEAGLIAEPDPDQACDLISGFGANCVACSSDGEAYCIIVEVRDIDGALAEGVTIEAVEESDCHETCAASCENAECPEAEDWAICG